MFYVMSATVPPTSSVQPAEPRDLFLPLLTSDERLHHEAGVWLSLRLPGQLGHHHLECRWTNLSPCRANVVPLGKTRWSWETEMPLPTLDCLLWHECCPVACLKMSLVPVTSRVFLGTYDQAPNKPPHICLSSLSPGIPFPLPSLVPLALHLPVKLTMH